MNLKHHSTRVRILLSAAVVIAGLLTQACKSDTPAEQGEGNTGQKPVEKPAAPAVQLPSFNEDSAYAFVAKQVSFGPRVPNTKAHDDCAKWLAAKMRSYIPQVEEQKGVVTAYDGTKLNITNIIATFKPDAPKRILLMAHWDSRPWNDEENTQPPVPIDAANDGGSGVAVLLELARQISLKQPEVGVTLLLVDAEDYGKPKFEDSYCLGTQYWGKNLDKTKFLADYGICLDMVGARGARFMMEDNAMRQMHEGEAVYQKIWAAARAQGFGSYFIQSPTGGITDDHVYASRYANITVVDIIDYDMSRPKGFGDYWHTTKDNMGIIDRNTLKAVGQTMTAVVYQER